MAGAVSHQPALYERDPEVEALRDFVERVVAADGGLLAVEGGAGMGKTRLLQEAARVAPQRGVRVLAASASELERDLPFGVMRGLFEPAWLGAATGERARWSEGAARLGAGLLTDIPAADAGPPAEPSFGALHGIYWFAVAVADEGATLLVVDDLQWADQPSVRALGYLARRLAGLPLGLAVSLRTGGRGSADTVAGVLGTDPSATLAPAPLGEDGVGRAAEDVLGRPLPASCVPVCRELTGGNPLLLRQLLEAVRADGIQLTPQALGAVGTIAPASLSRAVMLRLGRLPEHVRRLARVVAVMGDRSRLRDVCELARLTGEQVLAAAATLVAAGVFSDPEILCFAHPLIRAGVYGDLIGAERALLHGQAARILARDRDASTVAPHLLASEPADDRWVVDVLRAAARAATCRGAAATAVLCLRRALAEAPRAELRAGVLAELGIAEASADHHAAAVRHLREALGHELAPAVRRDAALALAGALVVAEGTQAAVEALARERSALDGDDALRLELKQTMLGVFEPALARWALERMKGFAALPGDTPTERYALANACVPLGMLPESRAADAVPVARRALAGGALARDPELRDVAAGAALYPLCFAGELDLAQREAGHLLDHARATGSPDAFVAAHCILCDVFRLRGDLVAAAADAELAIARCHEMVDTPTILRAEGATLCFAVDIELLRGNVLAAGRLVERSCQGRDLSHPQTALLRQARGVVALHEADLRTATRELEAAGAALDASGYEDRNIPWRLELARVRATLGDRTAAAELAGRQLALARTWGAPGGIGIALRVSALAAARDQAEGMLRESIALLGAAGFAAQLAWSRIELGSLLRRAGARTQAQELLRAGLDGAARCGARALVHRAHRELQVSGARPRRLAFSGLDSLTASERRVAAMARSGMTNREIAQALFVTLKTVEMHLGRTYRKLGIDSRAGLPTALVDTA